MKQIKMVLPILIFMLLGLAMVSATATFTETVNGATVSGSMKINISSSGMRNVTNGTISCFSDNTASTLSNLTLAYANENNGTIVNGSIWTWSVADSNDYACTGYIYNKSWDGTNGRDSATMTITVNNGVPVCSWVTPSTLANNKVYDVEQTWKVNGYNATSALIYFGSKVYTMSEASDVFSHVDTIAEAIYDPVYVRLSDGTDTVDCTSYRYIQIEDDKATRLKNMVALNGLEEQQQEQKKQTNNPNMLLIVLLGGVVIYSLSQKKGKK